MPANLIRSLTILHTRDHAKSRDFYVSLGFAMLGEWGEPPTGGIYQRGDVTVMMQWTDAPPRAHDRTVAYLYTDDADALHAEFEAAGIKSDDPPQDIHYGCRDFMVIAPNGHRLVFGQDFNPDHYGFGLGPDRGRE